MLLLKNKIIKKKITIAVIGIGYVGLPLCLRFLKRGFKVFGIDKNKKKIKIIKKGKSYIANINNREIKNAILIDNSGKKESIESLNFQTNCFHS